MDWMRLEEDDGGAWKEQLVSTSELRGEENVVERRQSKSFELVSGFPLDDGNF